MSGSIKLPGTENGAATWREALVRDGYHLFPILVPKGLIDAANDAIKDDLAHNFDPAQQLRYEYQSYCPDIRGSHVIRVLLENAAVMERIDAAVDYASLVVGPPQIAIRRARSALTPSLPQPHIDGIATAHNGIDTDEIQTFTLLVGVFLSEASQEYAGNLAVWPGSHQLIEYHFREGGIKTMHEGMPPIPLGEPRQIFTAKGDVILCHFQLAHAVAANVSPADRIAVYFRLSLFDLALHRWHRLTHIWDGWRIGPGA